MTSVSRTFDGLTANWTQRPYVRSFNVHLQTEIMKVAMLLSAERQMDIMIQLNIGTDWYCCITLYLVKYTQRKERPLERKQAWTTPVKGSGMDDEGRRNKTAGTDDQRE